MKETPCDDCGGTGGNRSSNSGSTPHHCDPCAGSGALPGPLAALAARLALIPAGNSEARLHARVQTVLLAWNVEADGRNFHQEFRLDPHNRIDFLAEAEGLRVGIECKTVWKGREVERQVYRYADHLTEIILLTAKPLPISSGTITNSKGEPCRVLVLELWKNQP